MVNMWVIFTYLFYIRVILQLGQVYRGFKDNDKELWSMCVTVSLQLITSLICLPVQNNSLVCHAVMTGVDNFVCGLPGVVTCGTFTSRVRQNSPGGGNKTSLYAFYQRPTEL